MKIIKSYNVVGAYIVICLLVFLNFFSLYPNVQKNNWQKFRFFDCVFTLFPVAASLVRQEIVPICKHLVAEYWPQSEQHALPAVISLVQETVAHELTLTRTELVRLQDRIYPHVTSLTVVRSADTPFDRDLVEILYHMFPSLEQLVLLGNGLRDEEFRLLADSPVNFRIRILDLTLNNLTAQSMEYLKSFTNLEELDLSTNNGGLRDKDF